MHRPLPHDRFPFLQERQVSLHFFGGLVTLLRIGLARLENHRVQFEHRFVLGQIIWQRGKVAAVPAGADFVKDFAQTVEIRLRCARPLRWNESFRSDERPRLARVGHQADVRQLGRAVHENDVRRFDIAVNQSLRVQVYQGRGK